jgi:hypothetical protein
MRTIIVPDLHLNHHKAESFLSSIAPYDRVIFLGDYFDSWNDTPAMNMDAAFWLKQSLKDPKRTHLWGNHDLSYFHHNYRCSGWSYYKNRDVNLAMRPADWKKLKFFAWEQGWLLSHAGVSEEHEESLIQSKYGTDCGQESLANGQQSWLTAVGRCRGGDADCGGPTWCDFDEFAFIKSCNQIFGHTHFKKPQMKVGYVASELKRGDKIVTEDSAVAVDLDAYDDNPYYGILENGVLQIV